jgi:bleomycin hydrolase
MQIIMKNKMYQFSILFIASAFIAMAQPKTNKEGSAYSFTVTQSINATDVQSQGKTGTCWTFSSLSFFESELMRLGKGKDFNLSEMFVVRCAYPIKAENYIRMHGKAQFAEGGEFHDVAYVLKNFGMVPQEIYNGNTDMSKGYNHKEMDSVLLAFVNEQIKKEKLEPSQWRSEFNVLLDKYLGKIPEKFTYKGKEYTPKSYAAELGINPDDYRYVTSFIHHPYYENFVLEIPDNWAWQTAWNLPLNEFMQVLDNSIMNGYGVGWAADVSEEYFKFGEGLAILPEDWENMNKEMRAKAFMEPVSQLTVEASLRQQKFDNYETQDDHGMHIIGIAKDQKGTKYYLVKNSWGKDKNFCGGYFYASEAYVRLKTISFMVHKNAIPKMIQTKLIANTK